MWVFTNNAFVSIVAHPTDAASVMVRGRVPGDLERFAPDYARKVQKWGGTDYAFRVAISRGDLARYLLREAGRIDYRNFKGSIGLQGREGERHDTYMQVWNAMVRWQHRLVGSIEAKRGRGRKHGGRNVGQILHGDDWQSPREPAIHGMSLDEFERLHGDVS